MRLHTKFHTRNSSGLLIIAIKPEAKDCFLKTAMLLFYIMYASWS